MTDPSKPNAEALSESEKQLLIERFFLDQLDAEEMELLESVLMSDRELRDRFRSASSIDSLLRFRTSDDSVTPAGSPAKTTLRLNKPWLVVAVAVLAASLLIAFTFFNSAGQDDRQAEVEQNEGADDGGPPPIAPPTQLAQFVVEKDLIVNGSAPDATLVSGDYEISDGEGTLRLENGVEITMSAPSKFRLVDAMRVEWFLGRARAVVPPQAHGFRIITPDAEVEDLGTEFGISVSEDQSSEVHVFAGEVRLHIEDQPPQRLTEDMAIQLAGGVQQSLASTSADSFITSNEIGFDRWRASSEALRSDPSTILYYNFQMDRDDATNLPDRSERGSVNAKIIGGIEATGRWPEKPALLLERPGDRVELSIPGEFDQVTLMTWIQVNRFDQPLQTLFNTFDWEPGEHHFNLLRSGAIRVGIKSDYALTGSDRPLTAGRWTQLVATIDSDKASYYINGELVLETQRNSDLPIVFGDCSIGAFGYTGANGTIAFGRELRGRIDEFALFSRAFSEGEIRKTYALGSGFGL